MIWFGDVRISSGFVSGEHAGKMAVRINRKISFGRNESGIWFLVPEN